MQRLLYAYKAHISPLSYVSSLQVVCFEEHTLRQALEPPCICNQDKTKLTTVAMLTSD